MKRFLSMFTKIPFRQRSTAPAKKSESLIFGKYMLLTNTVSSGLFMLFGDLASQNIEFRILEKWKNVPWVYDKERLVRMTLVGVAGGPLHHYTYAWMELFLPGNTRKTVFKKIAADQFIVSPIFIAFYFYTAGLLERKSLGSCLDELKEKFWTVVAVDWMVWPITQYFNFSYVPLQYRIIYINVVTTFYDCFLCYIKHRQALHPENNDKRIED